MRVSILGKGVYGSDGFTSAGGVMSGPLILVGNPVLNLEAATKNYVDLAKNSLSASNLSSGTIATGRLPSFNGDFTNPLGSNVFTLNASGVTPGTYTKVNVNSKGLITGNGSLVDADIPALDWSKIISGKPTTLAGYGITDGVRLVGDTLTGFLTLNAAPVSGTQLATKGYVDSLINTGTVSALTVGDIVRYPKLSTPTGFLRCNGGEVSKTTYAALYAVIGNTYSNTKNQAGAGKPWQQQYYINTQQSTDITGWAAYTNLPCYFSYSQVAVTKNRIYILGGSINGSYSNLVYSAPLNTDGTLGTWIQSSPLPLVTHTSTVITTKNRIHLIGGVKGGAQSNLVHTAPINSDGTIGGWSLGTSLPLTVSDSIAITTVNRVYLLGGYINGSTSNTVFTAPVNADGTLGTWATGNSIPAARRRGIALVTEKMVYLIGGYRDGNLPSSTVYKAPINADGTLGTWTTGTSFPVTVSDSSYLVTKNRAYILGGTFNSSTSNAVYTAPINADGTLGTWATGTSLPTSEQSLAQTVVTNNKVYILGGTYQIRYFRANISGGLNDYSPYYDGTIAPTDPSKFKLPDTTLTDPTSIYSYIKT